MKSLRFILPLALFVVLVGFLAVVNGDAASEKTVPVNLSFLQSGTYQAILLSDSPTTPAGRTAIAPGAAGCAMR